MELEELRAKAAELFPSAVRTAVDTPDSDNPPLRAFTKLCDEHYQRLDYLCHADLFEELVPKVKDQLVLDAWCFCNMVVSGWKLHVQFRPLYLGNDHAHFQINHNGAVPGFTETGYKSVFLPMALFAKRSPLEVLEQMVPKAPPVQQMMLF